MKHFRIGWVYLLIAAAMMAGCGGSSSSDDHEAAAPAENDWPTVATLRSTDPSWDKMDGILVSPPFTATGEARLVLNMPDAGRFEGLVGVLASAERLTERNTLLDAIREGRAVTLVAMSPKLIVPGLDGAYVFINSVPAPRAWTLDIQVRP